jgi:hypothetical protein
MEQLGCEAMYFYSIELFEPCSKGTFAQHKLGVKCRINCGDWLQDKFEPCLGRDVRSVCLTLPSMHERTSLILPL